MKRTRRHFIKVSAATGGALAIGTRSATLFAEKSVKSLRILILGGTGFTGPYQVRYALSRGHKVTTFNRGKTHPGELPNEVEQLIGDRNGQLDALKDRQWDVVIDNPTTLPAWVRDAAQILKGNAERYVFISTISVYGEVKTGPDETAPTEKYEGADPYKETLEAMKAGGYKTYGPLKALSEKEAEKWFPGKTLIIRPGLIVGPRDETDRFTYWPVRIDRGGEVLAPGSPDDPVQFIDARDLAEWTIRMAENRETGIYNATGPAKPLGIGGMLDGIKSRTEIKCDVHMGNGRFSHTAKSGAVVRHACLDWKRERTRSRKNRSRAEQRTDIPAARRNCARHTRVVQIVAARSTSAFESRSDARTRNRSACRVEEEKNVAAVAACHAEA